MAPSMHHTYPMVKKAHDPPDVHPRYGSFVFHSALGATMIHSWMTLGQLSPSNFIKSQYGGWAQYLTIIGILCTAAAALIAAASDLLPGVQLLRVARRSLLLVAFPVEVVIAGIYWPLLLFAKRLILDPNLSSSPEPSSSDEVTIAMLKIPLSTDLTMHALPGVALLLHFLLLEDPYRPPWSTWVAIGIALAFGATYSAWIEYCATINGQFPYPFLTIMPVWGRPLMYLFAVAIALGAFSYFNRVKLRAAARRRGHGR